MSVRCRCAPAAAALRRVAWAVVVAIAVGQAACATTPTGDGARQSAAPEDARAYYPLEPGWRWAYDIERGEEHILAVYAVKARQATHAEVQAGDETIEYEIGAEGIARPRPPTEASKRVGAHDFLLHSPVRMGASWPIEGGTASVTAVGRQITVPAGTYANCVTVEETRQTPTRIVRTTYAPGVGPVLIESIAQVPSRAGFETTLRATLRGVTRPGADGLD